VIKNDKAVKNCNTVFKTYFVAAFYGCLSVF